MKTNYSYRLITVFILLIAFSLKGIASSKIGEVKIDVGSSKTVQLNSAYLNTLRYSGTRIMSYSWSTSNSNITISSQSAEQAVIKGVKAGTAQLNYKCSYVIDNNFRSFDFYYEVTISGDLVIEADIYFETPFLFLDEGERYTINAIQSGVAGGVYFTTDDPQVATVEGGTRDGWKTPVTVTAVGAGVTNIYANTLRGLVSSCKVTVKPLPVPATEISLPESELLHQGQDFQLTAVITPENSTSQKTWSSDNTDVAVVSTNGLVVALSEGTATITVVTDNGLSATCCITVQPNVEPIAYAVLEQGVLTFYYDDKKDIRESSFFDNNNVQIKAGGVFELGPDFSGFPAKTWTEDRIISYVDEFGYSRDERIAGQYFTTNVVDFDPSFAACKLESTQDLFKGLENLTTINNIGYLNTSDVLIMSGMFFGCSSLTNLDLSSFNTSNVTRMDYMFYNCSSLTSLDLSSFNTSKIKFMDGMFSGCSSLTYIDLTRFNTSNVTRMDRMFSGCSSLTSLDLSGFNTSSVTSMDGMFSGCSSLISLDLSSFDTSNVTNLEYMFSDCSSLTSLDLSNFNTSNAIIIYYMFSGCSSLTSLDLSSFDTSNVTRMYALFSGCSSLTSLDVSSLDTSKITELYEFFRDCTSLTSLDLSGFDISNVTNMSRMFRGCSSLTNLNLSDFDTSNVTDMSELFKGCSSLSSLDLSSFDTSKVTKMYQMFGGCSSIITIFVGDGWQANELVMTDYGDVMFAGCFNLLGENGTIYNSEHTGYEYAHVDGGENNPGYFTFKRVNEEANESISIASISSFQPFCSENSLDFSKVDGLIAYIAVGYNSSTNEIMFMPIVEVPAGTGVLLKGDVGKTYSVPICSSNYKYNNSLVGVLQDTAISTGYVFDDGFKQVNSETVVPANSAYLLLPDVTDTSLNNLKLNMAGGSTMKGDANGDGTVDITDVVITVNLILGNE